MRKKLLFAQYLQILNNLKLINIIYKCQRKYYRSEMIKFEALKTVNLSTMFSSLGAWTAFMRLLEFGIVPVCLYIRSGSHRLESFQSRASIEKQEEITMKISIKITALLVALNISLTMSSPRDPRGFDFKKVDGWFQFEDGVWTRVNDPDSKTVTTSDKQALDLYRLGWATGDVEIILSSINKSTFTFTWVPDDNAVSPRDFPEFFKTFMKNAEKASNKKYFMAFDNIIHREVDGALYEAADWIVEGFGRGTYFNTAKNGRVTWDMATQSQLGQDWADRLLIMPLFSLSVYLIK